MGWSLLSFFAIHRGKCRLLLLLSCPIPLVLAIIKRYVIRNHIVMSKRTFLSNAFMPLKLYIMLAVTGFESNWRARLWRHRET